ncbi:5'-nucleotidase, lipoprotein e(P4) family [Mucilaginibacter defluvii]|uniref:5'-nucleotidase, lipoprotein e(P4) family n=1 Tax=Mucilaginibacter defluvii TaxID=1196019 RepID=A0ABP9FK12_9SPHI
MNKLKLLLPVAFLMLITSCTVKHQTVQTRSVANNGKAWASVWQQRAAEYKALCFQAYNAARVQVDLAIKTPTDKPLAIVTDIDETVLDNSPYDAQRALNNLEFDTKTWKAWTAKAIADTVAGAPAFLKYAASKGITVFYITNRDEDERGGTLKNLKRYGLPDADNAHLLLKQTSSSKESRRQQVQKTHNIILLCGDNLPDFDALYDNKPNEQNRDQATRKLANQFGTKYIVLPNPSYGDWEGALYKWNYKLTPAQKDSVIQAATKTDQ